MVETKRDYLMSIQTIKVPYKWIHQDEIRLNASYYAQDAVAAKVLLDKVSKKGVIIEKLGNLSEDVFHRTRFKRKYVSQENGLPFLTPTDLFMFPIRPRKFVVDAPDGLKVLKNWLLITCSGTIGRCITSGALISNCVLSHDIIRLIPKPDFLGYIYIYLNTWLGQAFLTKDRYGATVKHIEPHHVANIKIPIIEEIRTDLDNQALKIFKLREEAQKKIFEAEEMMLRELSLPKIYEKDAKYFGGQKGDIVKTFSLESGQLNMRFDASFNKPILTLIRKILNQQQKNGKFKLSNLSRETEQIFTPPRFKRIYVDNMKEGYPMLHGSHISSIKELDVKHLWKKMNNIEAYVIKKNWILVTCSGTIGKTSLVGIGWDNWTATNHMTRIITGKINSGFLTIYLQSTYGQEQLNALSYGGVVDEIGEAGELFNDVLIPVPSKSVTEKIGKLVLEAHEKKDEANFLENQATKMLESKLIELSL